MQRRTKIILLAASLPLWVITAGLALELGCRAWDNMARANAADRLWPRIQEYRAADEQPFQKAHEAFPPPDSVPWRAPGRETFLSRDEAGRQSLAKERRELILTCDDDGRVIKIYPCTATPELQQLCARISPGDSMGVLLPPAEFTDAVAAIHGAGETEKPLRDYNLPLSDGTSYLAEFHAMRISGNPVSFAVFLCDSRYLEFMRSYRPNIYRRNWYKAQFNESEFWTNSLGFRDREIVIPKPAGTVRIVCIGGSTTVEGPHNVLTYPKLLERRLREAFHTDAIEVINCGVDGLANVGEEERTPDWLALQPDLILHYNMINAASRLIEKGMENAWSEAKGMDRLLGVLSRSQAVSLLSSRRFFPKSSYYRDVALNDLIASLERIYQKAHEAGVSLAVASFDIPCPADISSAESRYFESTFHLTATGEGTSWNYSVS